MVEPSELQRWLLETGDALGVDPEVVDTELLLDLARDGAHGVARPAVPLTCFLVGLAVARGGGGHEDLDRIAAEVTRRASEWRDEA